MSYEIFYDRKFLKTTRGVIPMVLHGSNNTFCVKYDSRGRRIETAERHWGYVAPVNQVEINPDELLKDVRDSYSRNPNSELGKFRSKWIYGKDVLKWYEAGIKAAHTIEEYIVSNPGLSIHGYILNYKDTEDSRQQYDALNNAYIRTTSELEDWLDKAADMKSKSSYIQIAFSREEPLKSVSTVFGRVIAKSKHGYVTEIDANSISYSRDRAAALVFESREDAMAKLNLRGPACRFIKADTKPVEKTFVISVADGSYSSYFIKKMTSKKLLFSYGCSGAMHFVSEKAANKYIEKIRDSYSKKSLGELIIINTANAVEATA